MEQGFLGPKPEAQRSLRETALSIRLLVFQRGGQWWGPSTRPPGLGGEGPGPRLPGCCQGQENGRLELSLLLPDQLPLGSTVQAGNSSVVCNYSLKAFLLW